MTLISIEDLEDIGIYKLGHQKRLLLAVKKIRNMLGNRIQRSTTPRKATRMNSLELNNNPNIDPRQETLLPIPTPMRLMIPKPLYLSSMESLNSSYKKPVTVRENLKQPNLQDKVSIEHPTINVVNQPNSRLMEVDNLACDKSIISDKDNTLRLQKLVDIDTPDTREIQKRNTQLDSNCLSIPRRCSNSR